MFVQAAFILVLLLTLADGVVTQDCHSSGTFCADDYSCCGGCCRNNECIDTLESCILQTDPCETHYCPAELQCYIYHPQNCQGCSSYPDCRRTPSE